MSSHYLRTMSRAEAMAAFEVQLAKMPPRLANHYRECVDWDTPGEGAMWLHEGISSAPDGATIGALQQASTIMLWYHNQQVLGAHTPVAARADIDPPSNPMHAFGHGRGD